MPPSWIYGPWPSKCINATTAPQTSPSPKTEPKVKCESKTIFSVRYILSPVRLSCVVCRPSDCLSSVGCNVRAPYPGGSNFQCCWCCAVKRWSFLSPGQSAQGSFTRKIKLHYYVVLIRQLHPPTLHRDLIPTAPRGGTSVPKPSAACCSSRKMS